MRFGQEFVLVLSFVFWGVLGDVIKFRWVDRGCRGVQFGLEGVNVGYIGSGFGGRASVCNLYFFELVRFFYCCYILGRGSINFREVVKGCMQGKGFLNEYGAMGKRFLFYSTAIKFGSWS